MNSACPLDADDKIINKNTVNNLKLFNLQLLQLLNNSKSVFIYSNPKYLTSQIHWTP